MLLNNACVLRKQTPAKTTGTLRWSVFPPMIRQIVPPFSSSLLNPSFLEGKPFYEKNQENRALKLREVDQDRLKLSAFEKEKTSGVRLDQTPYSPCSRSVGTTQPEGQSCSFACSLKGFVIKKRSKANKL